MRDCRRFVKKRRGKKKLLIALLIVSAVIAAACIFISKNVNPMILTISNEKVHELANDALSNAVIDVMSNTGDVEYLKVERDKDGKIQSVDVDAALVSVLAQKITIEAQNRINKVGRNGIKIPLGSLSGITVFTGLGPDINIKVYLVGSTQTQILSVFSDAGINQTLHRLYLTVSGSVAVAVPGLPSTIKTSTQVLMSELIIVGEVPPTYLNSTNIGDMLDLVVR